MNKIKKFIGKIKLFKEDKPNCDCPKWFAPYDYEYYYMVRKNVFIPLWPIMALIVLIRETFITIVIKHLKAVRKLKEWRGNLNAKRKS